MSMDDNDDNNVYEETVKVASELYKRSGRVEGRDLENWIEAEKIVSARANIDNDNVNEETVKVASELYERSGRVEGRDLENWIEAKRIVSVGEQFRRIFIQMLIQEPSSAGRLIEALKPLTDFGQKQ